MADHARLPFSSKAGENHTRQMLSDPAMLAKLAAFTSSAGGARAIADDGLTDSIVNTYRKGLAVSGHSKDFEKYLQKDGGIEEREWTIKSGIVERVREWAKTQGAGEWDVISYTWLVGRGHLGGEADNFGGLVLTDSTMERFLLFNYYDSDEWEKYHNLNEARAKEVMSLLIYLGLEPLWVRSTYISVALPANTKWLQPLDKLDKLPTSFPNPPTTTPRTWRHVVFPIVHINRASSAPGGLKFTSFSKIEANLTKDFDGLKELGGGAKGRRSRRSQTMLDGSKACEECGKEASSSKALMKCSACRQSHYCSTECQRKSWPYHKVFCKT